MTERRPEASVDFRFAAGARLWVGGNNESVRRTILAQLEAAILPPSGVLDAIIVTPQSVDEWAYFLGKHLPRLAAGGRAWVVFAQDGLPDGEAWRVAAGEAGLAPAGKAAAAPGLCAEAYRRVARP